MTESADPVIETFGLRTPWPTIDPFLFCMHHKDAYPAGTDSLGPVASLAGRDIGQDFSGKDGWSMYHGAVVPGFPQHPHRGFETVTFVRAGLIDHSDSLGAAARFGRGDTQWLTAGGGVVHSEMFPLLDPNGPNPLELFQIWLNLPATDKMVDAYFTMFWEHDIPKLATKDSDGRRVDIAAIAGRLAGPDGDLVPPPPPPNSWASRPEADVAIWHLRLDAGAHWTIPAAVGAETGRMIYVFEGSSLTIGGTEVPSGRGALVRCTSDVELVAGGGPVEALVLQGRPIGEPVAQYGPFVMNSRAEIQQAFADYQRTGFGGWPWPTDDPVHGPEQGRFALHADGRREDV